MATFWHRFRLPGSTSTSHMEAILANNRPLAAFEESHYMNGSIGLAVYIVQWWATWMSQFCRPDRGSGTPHNSLDDISHRRLITKSSSNHHLCYASAVFSEMKEMHVQPQQIHLVVEWNLKLDDFIMSIIGTLHSVKKARWFPTVIKHDRYNTSCQTII